MTKETAITAQKTHNSKQTSVAIAMATTDPAVKCFSSFFDAMEMSGNMFSSPVERQFFRSKQ